MTRIEATSGAAAFTAWLAVGILDLPAFASFSWWLVLLLVFLPAGVVGSFVWALYTTPPSTNSNKATRRSRSFKK